jgi:hypothetical protein
LAALAEMKTRIVRHYVFALSDFRAFAISFRGNSEDPRSSVQSEGRMSSVADSAFDLAGNSVPACFADKLVLSASVPACAFTRLPLSPCFVRRRAWEKNSKTRRENHVSASGLGFAQTSVISERAADERAGSLLRSRRFTDAGMSSQHVLQTSS